MSTNLKEAFKKVLSNIPLPPITILNIDAYMEEHPDEFTESQKRIFEDYSAWSNRNYGCCEAITLEQMYG